MHREDIEQVLTIEKASFPSPWERRDFESVLEDPNGRNIVVKEKKPGTTERVVAYVCFRRITDEIHIVNISVLPGYRRQRIGSRLLQEVLSGARQQHGKIVLEVRPTNQAAILFYKKFGFKIVGRLPAYYSESGEDALIMSFSHNTKMRKE